MLARWLAGWLAGWLLPKLTEWEAGSLRKCPPALRLRNANFVKKTMNSEALFEQLKKFRKSCLNLLAGRLAGWMDRAKTKLVTPQGLERNKLSRGVLF